MTTIARIVGGPSIVFAHEPGTEGADKPEARWNVGRVTVLLDDDLRPHRVKLLDWFQPFSDPALTIYTFARSPEGAPK